MNGTIYCDTLEEVAEFLKAFCPSTAVFEVTKYAAGWKIVFLGGY